IRRRGHLHACLGGNHHPHLLVSRGRRPMHDALRDRERVINAGAERPTSRRQTWCSTPSNPLASANHALEYKRTGRGVLHRRAAVEGAVGAGDALAQDATWISVQSGCSPLMYLTFCTFWPTKKSNGNGAKITMGWSLMSCSCSVLYASARCDWSSV